MADGLLEAKRQGKSDCIEKYTICRKICGHGQNFFIWAWWSQHPEFVFLSVLLTKGKCLKAYQRGMDKWNNGMRNETKLSLET